MLVITEFVCIYLHTINICYAEMVKFIIVFGNDFQFVLN